MYSVERIFDKYEYYLLKDLQYDMSVIIAPNRGGMLIGLTKENKEFIYLDEDNFFSDDRPRCGMPILFPICGVLENNLLKIGDESYTMGIHGIAHLSSWRKTEECFCDGASITLELNSNEFTRSSYPYEFTLRFTYLLKNGQIIVRQQYCNTGNKVMPFSYGFHPYFKISKLNNLNFHINADYILSTKDGQFVPYDGNVFFPNTKEVGAVFSGIKNHAEFIDKKDGRKVRVKFDESFQYLLLWSIPEKNFICVEPWTELPNALNTDGGMKLKPDETWTASIAIEV